MTLYTVSQVDDRRLTAPGLEALQWISEGGILPKHDTGSSRTRPIARR